jgi:hypothetical protein
MQKEHDDRLRKQAQSKNAKQPACNQDGIGALWRRAMEPWSFPIGIMTIPEPKSVTRFLEIPIS